MNLDNLDEIFTEEALEEAAAKREKQLQQDEIAQPQTQEECESCNL